MNAGRLTAGVSFQQIQKYENGANRISFSRLVQISRALRCRVTDLMDVFDGADKETAEDLDLLTRMRTPGALELLSAFERLPPDVRSSRWGQAGAVERLTALTEAAAARS